MMNAYNPIQNVNTIIAERDQLKNDCANLSMQNQNYQNQLNAVINQSVCRSGWIKLRLRSVHPVQKWRKS